MMVNEETAYLEQLEELEEEPLISQCNTNSHSSDEESICTVSSTELPSTKKCMCAFTLWGQAYCLLDPPNSYRNICLNV